MNLWIEEIKFQNTLNIFIFLEERLEYDRPAYFMVSVFMQPP